MKGFWRTKGLVDLSLLSVASTDVFLQYLHTLAQQLMIRCGFEVARFAFIVRFVRFWIKEWNCRHFSVARFACIVRFVRFWIKVWNCCNFWLARFVCIVRFIRFLIKGSQSSLAMKGFWRIKSKWTCCRLSRPPMGVAFWQHLDTFVQKLMIRCGFEVARFACIVRFARFWIKVLCCRRF